MEHGLTRIKRGKRAAAKTLFAKNSCLASLRPCESVFHPWLASAAPGPQFIFEGLRKLAKLGPRKNGPFWPA